MLKFKNEKTINVLKFLFIALGITIFANIPYIQKGAVWGDDITYHLNRILSISEGLKNGQFPILIHSEILDGFGYGNPLFYPELFLYLPALLINIGLSISISYKIFIFVITFLTVILTYYSADRIFKNKLISWNITLIYTLATYRLGDIFVRAAIGEFLAFTFLPLIIAGLYEIIFGENKKWWLICFGIFGIVNSHALSFILTISLIIVICLINMRRIIKDKKRIINLVLAGVISILLSLSFLLPYIEQKNSNTFYMDLVIGGSTLYDNDSTIQDLFKNDLKGNAFDFSKGILLMLFPLLIFKCKDINYKKDTFLIQILVLGFITAIMTTEFFPWIHLPFFSILQFPYRISILTSLLLSFVSGFIIYEVFENKKDMQTLMTFLILLIVGLQLSNVETNKNNLTIEQILSGDNAQVIGNQEYLPEKYNRDIKYVCNLDTQEIPIEFSRENSKIEFNVSESDLNFRYHIPLTYYKGYTAYVETTDGNKTNVKTENDPSNGNVIISSEEKISGRVVVKYKITIIQLISFILTSITLIGLIVWICIKRNSYN